MSNEILPKEEARRLLNLVLQTAANQPGAKPKTEIIQKYENLTKKLEVVVYDGKIAGHNQRS